jgi:hypothetical protein
VEPVAAVHRGRDHRRGVAEDGESEVRSEPENRVWAYLHASGLAWTVEGLATGERVVTGGCERGTEGIEGKEVDSPRVGGMG